MMDISATDWAYFAGLFDGEGCVSVMESRVSTKRTASHVVVRIAMVDPQAVIRLSQLLPYGRLKVQDGKPQAVSHRRDQFLWYAVSYAAECFLRSIAPYVLVKKRQVQLAIEFSELVGLSHGRIDDAVYAKRLWLAQQISDLKRCAYPELVTGIKAKSANPTVGNAVLSGRPRFCRPKRVETKRLAPLHTSGEDIVHSTTNGLS